ncbi:hypothetical protein Tco_0672244, partial [Tanacetum coccineum]
MVKVSVAVMYDRDVDVAVDGVAGEGDEGGDVDGGGGMMKVAAGCGVRRRVEAGQGSRGVDVGGGDK